MIMCIYCKQEKPEPRRGEHILLEGLGGTTCIKAVCDGCNARLGRDPDQPFLRGSTLTFARLFASGGSRKGQVGGPQFAPNTAGPGYLDYVIHVAPLCFAPHPQVFFDELRMIALIPERGDEITRTVEDFLSALTPERLRELPSDIQDREQNHPARLVLSMKSATKIDAVMRARNENAYNELLTLLEKTPYDRAANPMPYEPPETMQMRLSLDLNVEGRCAAKMALNLACHHFGPELILGPAFDGVRAYILGEDVASGPAIAEDGEEGVRIDVRYLQEAWWDPEVRIRAERAPDLNCHAIGLSCIGGWLLADVMLYGGVLTIRPKLGRVDLPDRAPVVVLVKEDGVEQDHVATRPPR